MGRSRKGKDGLPKKKRVYVSKDILGTLEAQYGSRFSIVREVTIVDPEEAALQSAYYYRKYPKYYSKSIEKRGIDVDALPDTTDFDPDSVPTVRRIDALMIGSMDDYGEYPRTAVEIKTSRADFKRDTDTKRKAWFAVSHRFVYLVPEGLIKPEEVPAGCGLWYWVQSPTGNHINIVKRAEVRHNVDDLSQGMIAYLMGRVFRAEGKLRRAGL